MIELIIIFILVICLSITLRAYIKERSKLEAVEDRLRFIVKRAEDTFGWCNAEFPQIGHAALFIVAYDAKAGYVKEAIDCTHNGSVDQFRDYMRRWFKLATQPSRKLKDKGHE